MIAQPSPRILPNLDTPPLPVELRSEEVQEVLGQMPNWMIRWGITIIFSIVGFLFLLSCVVKYPDTLTSRVILTTQIPPVSLIARTEGLLKLFVKDNQAVPQGAYLAVLENPARTEDIYYVTNRMNEFKTRLYQKSLPLMKVDFRDNLLLGELQPSYAAFLNSLRDYVRTKELVAYDKQIQSLQLRIQQYDQLNEQLEKQHQLLGAELQLAQKKLSIDRKLFEDQVIAETDFDLSQNAYLQSKRAFESSGGNVINNQIMILQLRTQITESAIAKTEAEEKLQNSVESTFKALESALESWKQRFLVQTPIDGNVALVKYRSDNQFVRPGEEVMTVVPSSGDMYGEMVVPVAGSGKIELGQRVNIRFDNYPSQEYGMVIGGIKSISPIPRNGLYTVQIFLPQGLTTSYRKKLPFKQEMQGNAEIITQDLRLIERIFNQWRALMDQTSR